ncbi:Putative uncharacterized protein FLJ37770 [Eumeta japonica]|uniref:Histone-lysine N-methyltransferase SETMAR n=1 Tax=Eumeta variegata TaxID=151549 RepID=A0A4C1TBQ7_EUMVA|nr:Putative uncharacterized protein FLJ37770 [Eumeta japonica]
MEFRMKFQTVGRAIEPCIEAVLKPLEIEEAPDQHPFYAKSGGALSLRRRRFLGPPTDFIHSLVFFPLRGGRKFDITRFRTPRPGKRRGIRESRAAPLARAADKWRDTRGHADTSITASRTAIPAGILRSHCSEKARGGAGGGRAGPRGCNSFSIGRAWGAARATRPGFFARDLSPSRVARVRHFLRMDFWPSQAFPVRMPKRVLWVCVSRLCFARLKGRLPDRARLFSKSSRDVTCTEVLINGELLKSIAEEIAVLRRNMENSKRDEREQLKGRPVTVVTEENVRKIEKLVLADRKIKLWHIAEELQISKERVGEIIHEHMNMRKISARWVPKMLTPFDKQRRLQTSKDFLELVGDNIDEICDRIVTVDKPGFVNTIRNLNRRPYNGRKKEKGRRNSSRTEATWEVIARSAVLQDNASVHTARVSRQALKDTGFSEIDYPPYSPDLAPSDYFLFPI